MSKMTEFSVFTCESGAAEVAAIQAGVYASDPAHVPRRDYLPLAVELRDPAGVLAGGLLGATMWGWLTIDAIWVMPTARAAGHGSRLLQAAETLARGRGCGFARLDTFDFQARRFYESHGYAVYGQLEGFPAGHIQFHLRKALTTPRRPTA